MDTAPSFPATRVPKVILVVPAEAQSNGFFASRLHSLWRALCQSVELWRVDVTDDVEAIRPRGRRSMIAAEGITEHVETLFSTSGAEILILAGPVPLDTLRLRGARRVIWVALNDADTAPHNVEQWRFGQDLPDSFEPYGASARERGEDLIAVIGVEDRVDLSGIPPDTLALLRRPEVVVITQRSLALTLSATLGRPVAEAEGPAQALDQAGACLVLGADKPLMRGATIAWTAYAAAAGHHLLSPLPDDGLIGLDPSATLAQVRAALGLPLDVNPGATSALIRRNLGLTIETVEVTFHPWTQLYQGLYDIQGDLPEHGLSGKISYSGLSATDNATRPGLVNAWVRLARPPTTDAALFRANAVLPPSLSPTGVQVTLQVWGWPIAHIHAPSSIEEHQAGLIGLNVSGSSAAVYYWARDESTIVQLGKRLEERSTLLRTSQGLSVFRAEAPFPFASESLSAIPPQGCGQAFNQLHIFRSRSATSDRLEALKDNLAGQSAWLIGNGPSVRIEDLDRLAADGSLCFCFNRFHLSHGMTRLRPAFTTTGDRQVIEDFGQDIVDQSGGTVFIANEQPPPLIGDYIWVRQFDVFPSLFSFDAAHGIAPGGSSVYAAMQLGYWMGIRRWYFYGADFSFRFHPARPSPDGFRAAAGEGNHFITNYRSGREWCPPSIESILPSFHAARLLMESEGGFIRNTTRGGHLETFERLDFDVALAEDAAFRAGRTPTVEAGTRPWQ